MRNTWNTSVPGPNGWMPPGIGRGSGLPGGAARALGERPRRAPRTFRLYYDPDAFGGLVLWGADTYNSRKSPWPQSRARRGCGPARRSHALSEFQAKMAVARLLLDVPADFRGRSAASCLPRMRAGHGKRPQGLRSIPLGHTQGLAELRKPTGEVARQQRDVLAPLPQRGHPEACRRLKVRMPAWICEWPD
jgi:hypothetical protein